MVYELDSFLVGVSNEEPYISQGDLTAKDDEYLPSMLAPEALFQKDMALLSTIYQRSFSSDVSSHVAPVPTSGPSRSDAIMYDHDDFVGEPVSVKIEDPQEVRSSSNITNVCDAHTGSHSICPYTLEEGVNQRVHSRSPRSRFAPKQKADINFTPLSRTGRV